MEDAFHLLVVQVQKVVLSVQTVDDAQMLTMEAQTVAVGFALTNLQNPELEVAQTVLAELAEVERTAVLILHATHQTAVMAEEWELTTRMIVASVVAAAEVPVEE